MCIKKERKEEIRCTNINATRSLFILPTRFLYHGFETLLVELLKRFYYVYSGGAKTISIELTLLVVPLSPSNCSVEIRISS